MSSLFSGTLFLSALLLFCVQPLIAKMILPLLGGAPAVWNTCMVFFQAALLAGYLYAHALTNRLGTRAQVLVHLGVLLLPFLVLPLALRDTTAPPDADPVYWQLRLLVLTVGLPFFVVATSAPLLQKWFAESGHPSAGDPYFLYAASNLGSMVALLGYPFALEPLLPLADQSWLWTIGYGLLLPLIGVCGLLVCRVRPGEGEAPAEPDAPPSERLGGSLALPAETLTLARRVRWVALAAVPSSLLLAVTSYITTDVASLPLLWVVPLAIYLLTFILVFAQREIIPQRWVLKVLPLVTLLVLFAFLNNIALANWLLIPVHWLVLFVGAMTCHGELARDRPSPRHLTEFYLWMSFGGVVGGLFAALAAPTLFQTGVVEYPLTLAAACLLLPGPSLWTSTSVQRWLDLVVPLAAAALTLALALGLRAVQTEPTETGMAIVLIVPVALCVLLVERPLRFGLTALTVFFAFGLANPGGTRTRFVERNFFGVVRVYDNRDGFRILAHGSTTHGLQKLTEDGQPVRNPEPLSYFTRSGPVGQVFAVFDARAGQLPPRVAVTGLGVGAIASYARPGQTWTYYEIDPAIVRVAEDPALFTYLTDSPAGKPRVLVGDARLRLQEARDGEFGLLILDAFSSDAVPLHLISQEALTLYRSKLAPGGLLACNISNRYLDLKPVFANLAAAANPPVVCLSRDDLNLTFEEDKAGKTASQWVVLGLPADLGALAQDERWRRLEAQPGARVWTDDFSNLLSVVKWRQ